MVTVNVAGPGGRSNGTGEVIRSDGDILTNDHVVFPGIDGGSFTAVFAGGSKLPATVVGRSPELDLAVPAIERGAEITLACHRVPPQPGNGATGGGGIHPRSAARGDLTWTLSSASVCWLVAFVRRSS